MLLVHGSCPPQSLLPGAGDALLLFRIMNDGAGEGVLGGTSQLWGLERRSWDDSPKTTRFQFEASVDVSFPAL